MNTISRILRDDIWQFIGVIVGVVAILISTLVTYNISSSEREVKELQVMVLANASLVEAERGIADDIQLLYKDQLVSDLSLVEVKLENIGNRAVLNEDYAKPITFVFPKQAKVVEAAIIESNPPNLGMIIQSDQNTATLSPVLINPGDRVIARFLVTNMSTDDSVSPFTVDARIAEVEDIQVINAIEVDEIAGISGQLRFWLGVSIGALALAIIYILFQAKVWWEKATHTTNKTSAQKAASGCSTLALGLMVFACVTSLLVEIALPGTLLRVLAVLGLAS